MPYDVSWSPDRKGLYRSYAGETPMVEILKATIALHSDPRFNSLDYLIEDFTQVTGETLKPEEIQSMAKVVSIRANTKEHLKVALIPRNNPESIATANGFCAKLHASNYQCRVFLTREEAEQWATAGS